MKIKSIILVSAIFLLTSISCKNKHETLAKAEKPLVTFIELGSVRCISCQKMQVVMSSVEKNMVNKLTPYFITFRLKKESLKPTYIKLI